MLCYCYYYYKVSLSCSSESQLYFFYCFLGNFGLHGCRCETVIFKDSFNELMQFDSNV